MSSVPFAAGAPSHHIAPAPVAPGSDPVVEAARSLQAGAGPALGHASTCLPVGGTVSCSYPAPAVAPRAGPARSWLQLTKSIPSAPSARYVGAMAYDPPDHCVVLFGGATSNQVLSDTWTYSNGQWVNVTNGVGVAPPARYVASITFDAKDGYVLLFGGYNYNPVTYYNDTWKFDHLAWSPLSPTLSPPSRWRASMTYDAADGYVLLFGGTSTNAAPSPVVLSDTWKFVGGSWTNLTKSVTNAPPGRYRATMIYDPTDGYCVLFGGSTVASTSLGSDNTTWTYLNLNWTKRTPPRAPGVRTYYVFDWDAAAGYAMLFSGSDELSTPHLFRDTWEYIGGNWTNLTAGLTTYPSVRFGAMGTFDAFDNYTLFFGGQTTGTSFVNDTWSYGPSVIASARVTRPVIDLHQNSSINVSAISAGGWLNYSYTGLPPGCGTVNLSLLKCTPTAIGNFTVQVQVNASTGGSSSRNVSLAVVADPSVATYSATPATVTNGTTFHLNASVVNGSGSNWYRYFGLPSGCASLNVSNLSCTPRQTGTFRVEVEVVDSAGYPAFANTSVAINPKPRLSAFYATPRTVDVRQTITFQSTASGGTGTLAYAYSGLPSECGAPTVSQFTCVARIPGVYNVVANVTDAFGWVDQRNVTVVINSDPAIVSSAVTPGVIDLGASVTFYVNSTGGTGTTTTTLQSAPAGCAAAAGSSMTCTPLASGTFLVRVTVRDQLGVVATSNLTLVVNALPSIVDFSATPTTLDVGQTLHLSVNVSGGTVPYGYLYTGLPPGCAQSHNATVTCSVGTPGGQFSVGVSVSDVFGHPQSSTAAVTVNADPRVTSVSVSPNPVPFGGQITVITTLSGGTGPFSYAYAGLPLGCASRNNSGVVCTPRASGTFNVSVVVTDAAGQRTSGYGSLVVQPAPSGTTSAAPLGGTTAFLLLGVVVVVAAVIALALLLRRRRAPPPPADEPAGAAEPGEPAPEYLESPSDYSSSPSDYLEDPPT